jgi:hypothetical protein
MTASEVHITHLSSANGPATGTGDPQFRMGKDLIHDYVFHKEIGP